MASVVRSGPRGQNSKRARHRPIAASRRFQLAGGLLFGALVPYLAETVAGRAADGTDVALAANVLAVILAVWMRLSLEIYPGIRRSYVILPAALSGHGLAFAALLVGRLPYDRTALLAGLILHIVWLYSIYVAVERRLRRRIAVVPSPRAASLRSIKNVEWVWLDQPVLGATFGCQAITADFSAELPPEWEAFLAEAALSSRIVYQHNQLAESLTGRVELQHLSENTFGSLLPSRGYFHIKSLLDFLLAVIALPLALPLMGILALVLRADGTASPLFRQRRVGHAGREFTLYKFRTMKPHDIVDPRKAASTLTDDDRITRIGAWLRKYRLDELPQIFNILKFQMSWIGPRPEARALSTWYKAEIPFYVYRHVVKPGISGWAQVNQGHVVSVDDAREKLHYDFFYIKYFSPWLDVLIVLRTIKTMLTGFGSR